MGVTPRDGIPFRSFRNQNRSQKNAPSSVVFLEWTWRWSIRIRFDHTEYAVISSQDKQQLYIPSGDSSRGVLAMWGGDNVKTKLISMRQILVLQQDIETENINRNEEKDGGKVWRTPSRFDGTEADVIKFSLAIFPSKCSHFHWIVTLKFGRK